MNPLCDRAGAWISLEVDGELSELERALQARHLARCSACADFSAQTAKLSARLRAEPLTTPSRRPVVTRRRRRPLRAGLAAGVGVAAAFAAVLGSAAGPPTSTETALRAALQSPPLVSESEVLERHRARELELEPRPPF